MLIRFLTFAACALLLTSPARAEEFTKEGIQTIIREYLINNPDVMMDAMIALKEYQLHESVKRNEQLIDINKDKLFNNPDSASTGPKNASVTLVEFYDYNCGACKIMYKALMEYMKEDKDLRVVFKEYPIFGENSEFPARVAIAVHRIAPEKYFDFHKALMGHQGRVTPELVEQTLRTLGLDADKFHKEAQSKEVDAILKDVKNLADTLGATGTPLLVLNTEIIPHAVDRDMLLKKVELARGKKNATE